MGDAPGADDASRAAALDFVEGPSLRDASAQALVEKSPQQALEILDGVGGEVADSIRARARKLIRKPKPLEPPAAPAGPVDSDPYRSRPPRRRKRKHGS